MVRGLLPELGHSIDKYEQVKGYIDVGVEDAGQIPSERGRIG